MDNNEAVQVLWQVARRAPVTADVHERAAQAAQQLLEHFKENGTKQEKNDETAESPAGGDKKS